MADLDFVIGWSGSAASRGFSQLASQAKDAGTQFKTLKSSAESAGNVLKRAQANAAAATRKVAIEEAKLSELRSSGKAKISQILAAEDRLANARHKSADATEEVERATKDLERANKNLNGTQGRSSRLFGAIDKSATVAGKGISIAGRGLKTFGVAAAKVAGGGALALGAVGAAGAAMGVKVASGNEQARIAFTTMLGSAKKAGAFLKDLQKFAAETPFEFPELQTAASSLISAGVNANKVIPIMRTLGDVTSGMGTGSEGVQRATVALQQMQAAGRITAEDLNQLRDAGIPVYDLLAKATGKSKEEVVKLAQAGKLGKKELGQMMDALESGKGLERFSGLMEKQSKSLAGTWSTLKDTIGQGLGDVMANALPIMKQGIQGISSLATSAFAWVDKNKGSISTLFKTAGASLSAFGRIVSATFSAFIGSAGDGSSAMKSFANWVSTNQASIVGSFVSGGKAALAFGRGIASASSIGLRGMAALIGVSGSVRGVFLDMFSSLIGGAAKAFSWIPGIGPKLKFASDAFRVFAAASKDGTDKAKRGALALADGIDNNLIPGIDAGSAAMRKFGNQEIVKARQRDQLAKFSLLLQGIPKEKRAEVKSIFKRKGADEAYKAMERIKDKLVIAKSKGDLRGANAVNKAMKALRDRLILAKSRGDTKGARDLQRAINALHGKTVDGKVKPAGVGSTQRSINSIHGKSVTVRVSQAGAGTVQNTISSIHGKTVVIRTVKRSANADGGILSFADGGVVRGRGGPREDNIAIMDRASRTQIAWGSVGEFMTNASQYRKNKDQVETINAGGEWDLVPRRAAGGPIRFERPRFERSGGYGGGTVVNLALNVHAPNYVGTPADLVRALTKAESLGQLDTLKRRFLR